MRLPHLPTPDIRDEHILQHTQKQANKRDDSMRLRPPKLKPRYHHDSNFNRSQLSTSAHFISFRNDCSISNDSTKSSVFNRSSSDETYFEQYYTRISKIGEGSFGEVFKVRSKDDGLLYAVKMSKQLFRSEFYRQERLEEVKRYEQFSDHENCVRFYKAWEQDDRLYMQMELCQESLDHYLERKRQVPEEKIWSILLDLLLALKSLHDKNLIHLDIKLDNVLIGDDESCKLADFGLVIDVDRANRHEATEGDSRYIAPELMQGHFSKAADIFSLGISILELSCFLELPSNGPLWQQLRSGILPEQFIQKKSIDLQAIIKLMMTPDPQKRPTVDQLLNHKKIINLLQQRRRWDLGKKVKQSVRYSRRLAWSKLCNLKNFVFKFIVCLFTTFKLNKLTTDKADSSEIKQNSNIITNIISSTPTSNESSKQSYLRNEFMTSANLDGSQNCTPSSLGVVKIVNSTPLNHSSHNIRSRIDLARTSFKTVYASEEDLLGHKSNSFINFEDNETQSPSFGRSSLDTSVHRKLFSTSDDSD